MDGQEFKKIRQKLKLSAAALGHALGYEGSDANIARTIYRLESGRPIPRPIGRLLEMFDAFGVPRAWAGETAQRQHNARPKWTVGRPAGAAYDGGAMERLREIRNRLAAELEAVQTTSHGQETYVNMATRPVMKSLLEKQSTADGQVAISDRAP